MGKIPDELRKTIATNIRACRMEQFPGRGGSKKCAEKFGVSPQQWSPWESGKRTPDEHRLGKIAKFFGVTVAYMREDHSNTGEVEQPLPSGESCLLSALSQQETPTPLQSAHYRCPFYTPPQSGQPFSEELRSLCWLAERLFGDLRDYGLPVRLRSEDVDLLLERYFQYRTPPQ